MSLLVGIAIFMVCGKPKMSVACRPLSVVSGNGFCLRSVSRRPDGKAPMFTHYDIKTVLDDG